MLNKIIYNLGVKKRNPSLKGFLLFLKESDYWSIEKLEKYQFQKCRDFLQFAYLNSPFYKEEFDKVGFNPKYMQSINDIKAIPIIDKKVILSRNKDIHTQYKFKKKFFSETSGTSGQVLEFCRNEEWDSMHRASILRGYSWYGVKPWERNGYFWGYNISKKQRIKTALLDALQNRFRVFSYDENEIRKFVTKLKNASFMSGYSSMIYEVAKLVNHLGIGDKFNLKMVKGTSEKIYDSYQEEVKKAFGLKMISEYGSTESGIIAFECPEGGHMHINMENVYVEEVEGEIVVTNLMSKSFPIVRYKLGDAVKFAPSDYKCSCGRSHPIILDVLGRVGKRIRGKNMTYPSLTFYYVFKNLALTKDISLNYQAVQNKIGEVLIKIEQNNPEILPALTVELKKYFKNDVNIEIKWGEKLHVMNGKLIDFISTID